MILLGVGRHKRICTVQQAAVVSERIFIPGTDGRSSLQAEIAEPPFLIFLLERDVEHSLPRAVLHARGTVLLGLPVDDAYLVNDGSRKVVERRRLVVEEEGPATDGEFVDGLAIEFHLPVLGDLHSGHALDEVSEHCIRPDPERRGIELHRILLDDYGIAHVGYHRGLQETLVLLHADDTHVDLRIPEEALPSERLVSHHLHVEDITAERHFVERGLTLLVRESEIGDRGVLGRGDIDRGEWYRLPRKGVHYGSLDLGHPLGEEIVIQDENLCPARQADAEQKGQNDDKPVSHGDCLSANVTIFFSYTIIKDKYIVFFARTGGRDPMVRPSDLLYPLRSSFNLDDVETVFRLDDGDIPDVPG